MSPDEFPKDPLDQEVQPENEERFREARKSAQRFYFMLLGLGIIIGAVVSVGVVFLLERFDLTDTPPQFEQSLEQN